MANLTPKQTKAMLKKTVATLRESDAEMANRLDDAKMKELLTAPPAGQVTLEHIEQIQAQLTEIREILLSMRAGPK